MNHLATVVILLLVCLHAGAAERLSVRIGGAYTELSGSIPIDSRITVREADSIFFPTPGEVIDELVIESSVPFDTEGKSWEVVVGYRFWKNLHLQAGYVDLGSFTSQLVPVVPAEALVLRNPVPVPLPSPFPRNPLTVVPGPIFGGVAVFPLSTRHHLRADAWTLGLKADHRLFGRSRVYARAGALRARFDTSTTYAGDDPQTPDDETGWYWGVGLEYPLHRRINVTGGFAQYDLSLERFDSYQIGFEFLLL